MSTDISINPSDVKELRERTNAGMMDCKKALVEAKGNMEEAEKILRLKFNAIASKKADRDANEGACSSFISADKKTGALVEINCETDFVARNEKFQAMILEISKIAANGSTESYNKNNPGSSAEADQINEIIKNKIAELGENMVLRRFAKYSVAKEGAIGSYLHMGGRVGTLVEVSATKSETIKNPAVEELIKDINLQIAAANPTCLNREQVDQAKIEEEKAIVAAQVVGKPAPVVEKIVAGKIDKYYATVCLLEQPFIKDQNKSITDLLKEVSAKTGDTLSIVRFERYAIGA
jgi:elongation factor Ts